MKRKYSDYLDASGNWQLLVDGNEDSWCDYKSGAIDRILELLNSENDNELNKFEYEGDILNSKELKYELEGLSEEDFYTVLEDIKRTCDFSGDITLYNVSDENEVDFLKDDSDYYDFD